MKKLSELYLVTKKLVDVWYYYGLFHNTKDDEIINELDKKIKSLIDLMEGQ